MKKVISMLCVCFMVLSMYSCKSSNSAWMADVKSIKEGMTHYELIALMGEPDANLGSGGVMYMYILPDEHVLVVSIRTDYTRDPPTDIVGKTPVVETYDEFKERFKYYPDDPDAWWN